jgi:hypothetical protein
MTAAEYQELLVALAAWEKDGGRVDPKPVLPASHARAIPPVTENTEPVASSQQLEARAKAVRNVSAGGKTVIIDAKI